MDTNILYYGDNLEILKKYIPDNSIDLIYLDPPFNSKATYNILFKEPTGVPSQAQLTAFEDTWHWTKEAEQTFQEVINTASANVTEMLSAFRNYIHENDMMAYLTMMCIRLLELKRTLKESGSIYLHCDQTTSHYLKVLMDSIFDFSNFRNEIIWKRTSSHSDAKRYPKISDSILFYSKSENFTWNKPHGEYDDEYVESHYSNIDSNGRRFRYSDLTKPKGSIGYFYTLLGCPPPANGWRMPESRANEWIEQGRIEIPPTGKIPAYKRFLDEMKGIVIGNIWDDIPPINSQAKEALGYPTQKPEALLKRIINISSNNGDILLDPFCGCGTSLVVAHRLNRKWIGIDITHLAISTMKWRLDKMFPNIHYKTIGEPKDEAGAVELAKQNKYQFQWWAVSLVGGQPYGNKKKGADTGIDGYLYFMDEKKKVKKSIISIKGGTISVSQIRDLIGVVAREKAEMGVFITLEPPTKPMEIEALSQGYYHSPLGKDYTRIQILTIADIFKGKKPDIPPWISPIATHGTAKKTESKYPKLL